MFFQDFHFLLSGEESIALEDGGNNNGSNPGRKNLRTNSTQPHTDRPSATHWSHDMRQQAGCPHSQGL